MVSLVLATFYTAAMYGGEPLYCSTPETPLFYDTALTPWIAFPDEDYLSGNVQCGDLFYIRFPDGTTLLARALDAGPFASYCVQQADGACPPIGLDVPEHLWPMDERSAFVEVYNVSAAYRALWAVPGRPTPRMVGGSPEGAI